MLNFVTPGWLATYGTAIDVGRDINYLDTRTAPQVVLVNEAFVRKFFSGRRPIGETVAYAAFLKFGAAPKTVVGVVDDAVYVSLRSGVPPTVYVPLAQWDIPRPMNDVVISVRSSAGPPVVLARSVAAALSSVDRDLTFSFRSLEDQVNASLTQERLVAILSGFFGTLALLLAGLGLYGLAAYSVSRRRSEIGIRIALGASRTNVVQFVVSRVAFLIGIGAVAGTAASLWLSRFVAPLLYGLEPRDPMSLLGAVVVLVAVGLAACSVPATRAARIDPAAVLRES